MSDSDKENDMNALNTLNLSTSSFEQLVFLEPAFESGSDSESSGQYDPEECQAFIDYLNRGSSDSESGRNPDPGDRQALVDLQSRAADNSPDVIYINFCFCL